MEKNTVLEEYDKNLAAWCAVNMDSTDLAAVVNVLTERGVSVLSVPANVVETVWPWVEKQNVKIMARFYFPEKNISEKQISDVTQRINTAFKQGANGAQVFLPYAALADLVQQTHLIRDDLFFNKFLSIGVDISEIDSSDWGDLFQNLNKINASALTVVLTKDDGNKSDFVGRIYGMLDAWNQDNKFDLHFAFGPNFLRIEQALRLVKIMQPSLMKNMRFFVNV